jgi:hypothetical protein
MKPTMHTLREYEQQWNGRDRNAVSHMYGEHFAVLRAQAQRRRLAALFADSVDDTQDQQWLEAMSHE